MKAETGCDAVMIGRAASTNPWIFRQIAEFAATGRYDEPTDATAITCFPDISASLIDAGWPDAIGKMKQFACLFTHGVRNGAELRRCDHCASRPRKFSHAWMRSSRAAAALRGIKVFRGFFLFTKSKI